MSRYILALDQGTTSSRAAIVDASGAIVALDAHEFPQLFPHPGWVEHDPEQIWQSQLAAMRGAIRKAGVATREIAAIGITNQRETALVWDRRTGTPLHNAIVWQSRQTAPLCSELVERGLEPLFRERTGLRIDAYFSGTKIRWILDAVPDGHRRAQAGELACGTVDTWLIHRLTGGRVHATDCGNASRTLLYDIHRLRWDEELLAALEIPATMLPEVRDSSGPFGKTAPGVLDGASIPICGVAGDQQAALFGQRCFAPGATKNTYGTGCFLLMNTGTEPRSSQHGLLTTIAWRIGGKVEYALEGAIFVAGAAVQWLRDQLGLVAEASQTRQLAESISDTGGVYLVPAFTGLGAPYWDPDARGALLGLTRGSGRAEIARAALESIAYQTRDVLECFRADTALEISELRVDGGATANDLLMQFQADLIGAPVQRPAVLESTVLGAAYLAGLGCGMWADRGALPSSTVGERRFEPQMPRERADALYAGWCRAVRRVSVRGESQA